MTVQNKTTVKTYFETGDKPSQAQFADLIDSYQDFSQLLSNIVSAASAGTGVLNIVSTSAVSLIPTGAVGRQIMSAATTAAAQAVIGISSIGTVGGQILTTNTTASATNALGGGTVGVQVFQATTTTQATNALGLGSGTYQPTFDGLVNVTNVSAAPWIYSVNASAVVVTGNLTITNTSAPAGTGVLCEIYVSLPVASTFAAKSNCNGIFTTETTAQTGGIACVATESRARINYIAKTTDLRDSFVVFQYRII